jgi:formate hydrogenlyase subunit 6/NADH:ubiquinone oxidoreductase subunit I
MTTNLTPEPETNAPGTPQVDQALCTLCGLCVETCPCNAVQIKVADVIFSCQDDCVSDCQGEGEDPYVCEEVCPTGAIACAFDIVVALDQDAIPLSGSRESRAIENKENDQG